MSLAGRVIASHYAEPLEGLIANRAAFRSAPSPQADQIAELLPGDPFEMLDERVGWAWGYGGRERRVGYVPTDALESSVKH